ncbi:MAG: anaerobic ribonucleoside-triphosphate reductase activating protein, partial [Pseudomonadota bacterium]
MTLKVGGITPFSTTDFPGKLATVMYVQGCPWHCTYCHNPHLQARQAANLVPWERALAFLRQRVGLVEAVIFSGGEPTLDPALAGAIGEVRALGFMAGLQTACIYPARLQQVLPLIDWIAFDVKAPFADYANVTGVADSALTVQECIDMIVASGVEHECSTTIHPRCKRRKGWKNWPRRSRRWGSSATPCAIFASKAAATCNSSACPRVFRGPTRWRASRRC